MQFATLIIWEIRHQSSDLILPLLSLKISFPSQPLPPLIFSYLQALIHGFLWWWSCSWLIFSLKWRLLSLFLLHYSAQTPHPFPFLLLPTSSLFSSLTLQNSNTLILFHFLCTMKIRLCCVFEPITLQNHIFVVCFFLNNTKNMISLCFKIQNTTKSYFHCIVFQNKKHNENMIPLVKFDE